MNRLEAKWIMLRRLAEFHRRPYAKLCTMIGESYVSEVVGTTGAHYSVDIQVFWDDKQGGDIRVLSAIDDGGWSAFVPLSCSALVCQTTK